VSARTIMVMPCISAQSPAKTSNTYALWMKNWPEVHLGGQEEQPDEDADGGDGRLVELQDD
jgi:hypothetical protein